MPNFYKGKLYGQSPDLSSRLQDFVSCAWKNPSKFVSSEWSSFVVSQFDETIATLPSTNTPAIVFSEEKLLLNCWQLGFGSKLDWTSATIPLQIFAEALSTYKVSVFCTVRNPIEYIRSIYVQTMFTRRTLYNADILSFEDFLDLALIQYEVNSFSSPLFPVFRKEFFDSISSLFSFSGSISFLYIDFPSGATLHGSPNDSLALLGSTVSSFYSNLPGSSIHNVSSNDSLKTDIARFAVESSALHSDARLSLSKRLDFLVASCLEKHDILNLMRI